MQASRHAPAVRLDGQRPAPHWRRFLRGAACLVVLGTAAWWLSLWQQGSTGLAPRAVVPLVALLGAAAVWPRRHAAWQLQWDGATWQFDGSPCHPVPMIDLGRWMLLRLATDAGTQWLALAETQHPGGWHALRCALYCARPAPLPPPGHGAAPTPDER